MKEQHVLLESPHIWDYLTVQRYIKKGVRVWVVEPFHSYHHRKGLRFFPPSLPNFIQTLIEKGMVQLIKADRINAKEIYKYAADKAVNTVESVYPYYKVQFIDLVHYVCTVLKSHDAENIFKKHLCDRLAEFYSMNMLLHRVQEVLAPDRILAYPDTNTYWYHGMKSILLKSRQDFYEHLNIRFPLRASAAGFLELFNEYIISVSRLCAQTLASAFLGRFRLSHKNSRKTYSYGITVLSPLRQLTKNRRGPDFLIDGDKIRERAVVYFPLAQLTENQKIKLAEMPGEVFYPPKKGQFFSHYSEWNRLLRFAVKKSCFLRSEEINAVCNTLFSYFSWLKVMESVKIKNFVTHSDFGINHIGRNIALKQAGVETWYYTDSMNQGCNWKEGKGVQHPFWAYLYYDNYVAWDELLAKYFSQHPGSFKRDHVVGCLWSGHINGKSAKLISKYGLSSKHLNDYFLLTAFDSTFSRNGLTSYTEGLAFAEHLLQLVSDYPDIHIFLKEKKQRSIHCLFDPELGPALLTLYAQMDAHPLITTYSDKDDSSDLISVADMVVSFPFTSTTFEALSINKPAVWHDPLGYYMNTPYGKAGGVTTHNYDELKLKIQEIKGMDRGAYKNPLPKDSPLMDPYRDGKAIDRFRELLCARDGHDN